MSLLRTSRLRLLAGLVVLFAFGGDIVADSIVDAQCEHCAGQTCPTDSDHEKTPCSHCSCASARLTTERRRGVSAHLLLRCFSSAQRKRVVRCSLFLPNNVHLHTYQIICSE